MKVNRKEISEAIRLLLAGEDDAVVFWPFDLKPEEINSGKCGMFAEALWRFLGKPQNAEPDCDQDGDFDGHVWLYAALDDGAWYFDAEAPDGVRSPGELPFFIQTI